MVPMLIHLPPVSDDTEVGGRDEREVTDQVISQAQTLYDIIASTATTGFKSKFYGQRHIAFEIIGYGGMVYYYVAAPVVLQEVINQAIVSAYPTARLEEAEEHNIFNEVGKIGGVIGGEFELKEDYANPIATYQDTKRDGMETILNSMASLKKEDGVGIQILIRPARDDWTKSAIGVATQKADSKHDNKKGFFKSLGSWIAQIPQALTTTPEGDSKPGGAPKPSESLSKLEQAHVDSIEEKTRYAGYETLIRVVASSNTAARSQAVLSSVVASFSIFDSPGKNGFKFAYAKDIEKFVTAFIFRFFPPELNSVILNTVELSTIFHLPDQRSTPTTQLERQMSKQVDGPRNVPDDGTLLGYNVFRGAKKEIRLANKDRRRHLYILGQTGTGKTVLQQNLVVQDMYDGRGLAYIDPHGDAAEELLQMVPKDRIEDVVYFNPGDMDYPMGLNMFEYDTPEQKDFLIQEAIGMLYKLYDPGRTGIIGPRYENIFRNCALLLMADPNGSSLIDIVKLFRDNNFIQEKLKHTNDETVIEFWTKEIPQSQRSNEFGEVKAWFVSKFSAFLSNEMMRNMIGQTQSSFNLREIMDEKKILIINLSKGRVGELNSKLLGMIFVMKLNAAAMSRSDIPEEERVDFTLYVDEFQNFSTESFATILSEARKFRLSLIVANQFIGQLTEDIRDAVFGNVGSKILLRASANDGEFLVKYFQPTFGIDDIIKMPNYHAVIDMIIGGVPTQPFSMNLVPPIGNPNKQLGGALKKLSAAKYGKPRAVVEKEIFERLQTKAPAKPAFGAGARAGLAAPAGAAPSMPPAPGAKPASFVDQWLAKKNNSPVAPTPLPPAAQATSTASAPLQPTSPAPAYPAPVAPSTAPVVNNATTPLNPPIIPATPTPQSSQQPQK